jgi:hypothetical protein
VSRSWERGQSVVRVSETRASFERKPPLFTRACVTYSAGWGGCVVSLIPKSREASFIAHITDAQKGYEGYKRFRAEQESTGESEEKGLFKDVVFKTIPGSGAGGTSSDRGLLSVQHV